MIDNFKNTAVVLLTLSLIDGVINVAEWLTAMDVFKTTFTVGMALLLASVLLDKRSSMGQFSRAIYLVVSDKIADIFYGNVECNKEKREIDALVTAMIAHVNC